MEHQVCHPLAYSSLRYSRSGTYFTLHVQESLKFYRPEVRKVTPESHALHHLVNRKFQHTTTHILGPLASFGGILVLRGSFPPQNGCLWASGGLPPRFLP